MDWQMRPDPRGLANQRRKDSVEANPRGLVRSCATCGGLSSDDHDHECPHGYGEALRREAVVKNGLDERVFAVFLRLLAKRYECN
jgi:hypothetical protein